MGWFPVRRGGRVVEGAPLLRAYGSKAHRGFESLPLRQSARQGLLVLRFLGFCSSISIGGIRTRDIESGGSTSRRDSGGEGRRSVSEGGPERLARDERRSREQSLPLRHIVYPLRP